MTRWQISHRTTYAYDDEVTDSYGVVYVTPRTLPWQQVHETGLVVDPTPADLAEDLDYYGNTCGFFQVTRPHRELGVHATAVVDVVAPVYDQDALAAPWEQGRPDAAAWRSVDFTMASSMVALTPDATAYAARSLLPGRPIGEAVTDLVHRVHGDFEYRQGATTVTSTVEDVLAERAGVCQDFAHLLIAGLRGHGLAVRYVSGYLATTPAPGQDRVVGADASHAWAAVRLPGAADQWLAVDPTNDQWVADRHVTVAWGRDYADVPPVKGVIFTEAKKSTMTVAVDVVPA
ncbi:transglutaminase family protein [Nocardioides mangrovicus]|uniref:Transglutaminase family protein n=1 Tax=Nocardioides mangrovicus TaxID=2478913 RepID=A0A3L8NXG7_9ACTN|nr:transglutaminase family protein [Nocardioides mangrovicus]RLV47926.1 transglutaminase family protein [Nocardioides mangrovicus]